MTDRTLEDWLVVLDRVHLLTAREQQVFGLLLSAPTYGELAGRLHVTERTVRAHVSGIQRKLRLHTKVQVCTAAVLHDLQVRRPSLLAFQRHVR